MAICKNKVFLLYKEGTMSNSAFSFYTELRVSP